MNGSRIELEHADAERVNSLFTSLIVPRPIGWVVTRSSEGDVDAAPFSSLTPVCNKPPLVLFSAQRESERRRKLTVRNILETGEYVIHVVDRVVLERAVATARAGEDMSKKLEVVDAQTTPSALAGLPRIVECPVALECSLHQHLVLGGEEDGADLLVGRVLAVWVAESFDPCDVAGAMGVGEYLVGGDLLSLPNPSE